MVSLPRACQALPGSADSKMLSLTHRSIFSDCAASRCRWLSDVICHDDSRLVVPASYAPGIHAAAFFLKINLPVFASAA